MDRDLIRRIAREGPDALGEGRAAALTLDQPIDEDMSAGIRQVIFDSHCQQLPEPMLVGSNTNDNPILPNPTSWW